MIGIALGFGLRYCGRDFRLKKVQLDHFLNIFFAILLYWTLIDKNEMYLVTINVIPSIYRMSSVFLEAWLVVVYVETHTD